MKLLNIKDRQITLMEEVVNLAGSLAEQTGHPTHEPAITAALIPQIMRFHFQNEARAEEAVPQIGG